MESTGYSIKVTTKKTGKYLKLWERKTRGHVFAHLLTCLSETEKEIYRKFTENCFATFDQSSHVVLITWYCYPLDGSMEDFW